MRRPVAKCLAASFTFGIRNTHSRAHLTFASSCCKKRPVILPLFQKESKRRFFFNEHFESERLKKEKRVELSPFRPSWRIKANPPGSVASSFFDYLSWLVLESARAQAAESCKKVVIGRLFGSDFSPFLGSTLLSPRLHFQNTICGQKLL